MKLLMQLEWSELRCDNREAIYSIFLFNKGIFHRISTYFDEPKTSLETRAYWEGVAKELKISFELDETTQKFFDNGRRYNGHQYD